MSGKVITLAEVEYARRIRNYGRMTNAPDKLIRSTVSAGLMQLRSVRADDVRSITVPRNLGAPVEQPEPKPTPEVRFEDTAGGWIAFLLVMGVAAGVAVARLYLVATGKPV